MAPGPAPASDNLFIGDLPLGITDDVIREIFGQYGKVTSCKAIPAKPGSDKSAALVRYASVEEASLVKEKCHHQIPDHSNFPNPIVVTFARNGSGAGGPVDYWSAVDPWGATSWSAPWGKGGDYGKGAWGPQRSGAWSSPRSAPYGAPAAWAAPGKGGGSSSHWGSEFRTMFKGLLKGGILPGAGGVRPEEQCVYISGLPKDTTDGNLYEIFSPFGPIAPGGVKVMTKDDGMCAGYGFCDFQDPAAANLAVETLNGVTMQDGNSLSLNIKRSKKGKGEGSS